jgi:hypothetical protein
VRQKLEKVIPDQPKNVTPVHLRPQQVLADQTFYGKPFVPGQDNDAKKVAANPAESKQAT